MGPGINYNEIINHWGAFSSADEKEYAQLVKETKSLAAHVRENRNDPEISAIADKINASLQNKATILKLKENFNFSTVASESDDFSQAIIELGNSLLHALPEKAKECGENLQTILPSPLPDLPLELHKKMTSLLSPKEQLQLARASRGEWQKFMAHIQENQNEIEQLVKGIKGEVEIDPKVVVDRINKEQIPLMYLGFENITKALDFFGEDAQKITFLDASELYLTDDDYKVIGESFPKLNHLAITYTKITETGLSHLKALPLTTLDLSRSGVDDYAFLELVEMPLTSLNLSGTLISGNMLEHLRKMPLTSLDLNGCLLITDEEKKEIMGIIQERKNSL